MNTDVEIEPPGLGFDEDDDDGEPYTAVHVAVIEADGTRRAGYGGAPGNADDDAVAAVLVDALHAVAASRGPGLSAAVNRKLKEAR